MPTRKSKLGRIVLDPREACPKQPLPVHQFYTGDYERDAHGCDIRSITVALNNTANASVIRVPKDKFVKVLLGSSLALSLVLLIGWILTCALCSRSR